ncbi:MAG: ABC transporter ATP-binding protein [Dehalococcoidia bacterium]
MSIPLLEARNVTRVFGTGLFKKTGNVAVDNISLTISEDRPTITAIAGESGSGKTTLARLLLGALPATEGEVLYKGDPLSKLSRHKWREFRREVQTIFQDPFDAFNPFYKVDHVLTVPLSIFKLARSRQEANSQIVEALELVGLRAEDTLGRYPHQLSGGQRQRLMVARALLLKPKVILADEPVSMVDASLRATILESILKLKEERSITVLYITHDLTTAYQVSDRMIVLYKGSIAEAGDVEQVIHDPQHPYTKLLISSIPQPDPKEKWEKDAHGGALRPLTPGGCKFVDRCPAAFDRCHSTLPPLYMSSPGRAAACFLYRDHPVVEASEVLDTTAQPAL